MKETAPPVGKFELCPRCGESVHWGGSHCSHCGFDLRSVGDGPTSRSAVKWLQLLAVIAGVACLAAMVVALISGKAVAAVVFLIVSGIFLFLGVGLNPDIAFVGLYGPRSVITPPRPRDD